MRTRLQRTATLASVFIGAAAQAGEIQVIFSEITTHPSGTVPGALDSAGSGVLTNWLAIEDLAVRHDGGQWCIKGRTTQATTNDSILILGSGLSGTMFCQDGQPIPGASPELFDFFDSGPPISWDESGKIGFSFRAKGGATATAEKVATFDGTNFVILHKQGDAFPGLSDIPANPTGDELIGNSVGSVTLLNNGTFLFGNTPVTNCSSFRYPAVFRGNGGFLQSGVTQITSLLGVTETWDNFLFDSGGGTPDGNHWFWEGDTENATTTIDAIFAVDGVCIFQENQPLPGSTMLYAETFQARMLANGDWVARGDDPLENDWAVRNGVLLAKTGDAIPGSPGEVWGVSFLAVTANRLGDWLLAGSTTGGVSTANTDTVLVLNGQTILAREGDPIDLNENGANDDDVFLASIQPNDVYLTDAGVVWFLATLRNGAGTTIGDAFLTIGDIQPPLINEVLADASGADDGKVFIELGGKPGFDLSGYELRFVSGNGAGCGTTVGSTILPPGSTIQSDGLFVAVDGDVSLLTQVVVDSAHNGGSPDLVVADLDAPDGPDAVQLRAPNGALIDVVGFGAVACATDAFGSPMYESSPAPGASSGSSIARNPHLGDTGDNSVDFAAQVFPTPGAPATTFGPNIPRLDFDYGGLGGVSAMYFRNGPQNGQVATLLAFANGPATPVGGTIGNFLLSFPILQLFVAPLDASGSVTIPIIYPPTGFGPFFVALQGIALPSGPGLPTWTTNITFTEGSCACAGQSTSAIGVANYIDYQQKWELTIDGPNSCPASANAFFTWVGVVHVDANGNETFLQNIIYAGSSLSASGFKSLAPGERIEFRCFDCSPQSSSGFSTTSPCYQGLLAKIEC